MSRKTLLLLLCVLIAATFLRTFHLTVTPPGLYPDEAMDGSNALEALRTHAFKVFYPENAGREGLFMNVQAVFLLIFGLREPWVLRAASAMFGILTVAGLFVFARELLDDSEDAEPVALLAAFFLATSFWHINFSRISFRAISAPFFIVWALYFLLGALRRNRHRLLNAVLAATFFSLGFYSYISYRVLPLLLIVFIPFFRRVEGFRKISVAFLLTAFIVAAPIGWYFLEHPADFVGRASQISIASSPHPLQDLASNVLKTIGMLNWNGDDNWRHNVAGRPELFWPVGVFFWIGLGLAIRDVSLSPGQRRFQSLLLFAWIGLAAVPVVLSNERLPHALRSLLMICPIMLLAGSGALWLYRTVTARLQSHGIARMVTIASRLLLLLLFLEAYRTYFVLWAESPNLPGAFTADYAQLGRELRAMPDSVPKYVILIPRGLSTPLSDPWNGNKVHDLPIFAQPILFMTDTFSPERQVQHNVHYVVEGEAAPVPGSSHHFTVVVR